MDQSGQRSTIDVKEIYNALLAELRHRHDSIWRTRQIFSTVVFGGSASVIFLQIDKWNWRQIVALFILLVSAIAYMILVDYRYQKKKDKLLNQLGELENTLGIDPKWHLGNPEGFVYFWVLYLVIIIPLFWAFFLQFLCFPTR
ncbi:MAG: hypothetical protein HYZ50_15415 [Deltaproteobacteria bacterium]|nr:hypothetical protein [Deltaproteobacteria bacterium]